MSATAWDKCPKCVKNNGEQKKELKNKIKTSYGKISVDEFDAMRDSLTNWKYPQDTLEENYECYISGDKFVMYYYATCIDCGFTHEYDHNEPVTM